MWYIFFISFVEMLQGFICFCSQSLLNIFKINTNKVRLRTLEALNTENIICDSQEIKNTKALNTKYKYIEIKISSLQIF